MKKSWGYGASKCRNKINFSDQRYLRKIWSSITLCSNENKLITEILILDCVYTKIPQLIATLKGFMTAHCRMLTLRLTQIECLEKQITEVKKTIHAYLELYEEYILQLEKIPRINRITAAVVLAEIGIDIAVFLNKGYLAS